MISQLGEEKFTRSSEKKQQSIKSIIGRWFIFAADARAHQSTVPTWEIVNRVRVNVRISSVSTSIKDSSVVSHYLWQCWRRRHLSRLAQQPARPVGCRRATATRRSIVASPRSWGSRGSCCAGVSRWLWRISALSARSAGTRACSCCRRSHYCWSSRLHTSIRDDSIDRLISFLFHFVILFFVYNSFFSFVAFSRPRLLTVEIHVIVHAVIS